MQNEQTLKSQSSNRKPTFDKTRLTWVQCSPIHPRLPKPLDKCLCHLPSQSPCQRARRRKVVPSYCKARPSPNECFVRVLPPKALPSKLEPLSQNISEALRLGTKGAKRRRACTESENYQRACTRS